jgi:alkylated DNA nucleotide flippase Atl1
MAQNKREEEPKVSGKSTGKLTAKVSVDTTDAVTALKALQRHARETTKALREVEEAQVNPWYLRYNKSDVIRAFSTQELADELARREGVEEYSDLILREVKPGEPLDFSDVSKVIVVNGG